VRLLRRRAYGESAIAQERCAQEAAVCLWMPNGIPYRLISLSFEVKVSAQGAEVCPILLLPQKKGPKKRGTGKRLSNLGTPGHGACAGNPRTASGFPQPSPAPVRGVPARLRLCSATSFHRRPVAIVPLLYAILLSILRSLLDLTFQTVYRRKNVPIGSWKAWLECPWGADKYTTLSCAKRSCRRLLPQALAVAYFKSTLSLS
jgi:hypothetical protein